MRGARAEARSTSGFGSTFAIFTALTLLVWGLFAADRGLWQDDAVILSWVCSHGSGLARFFIGIGSPTRVLAGTPFALARLTSQPLLTLQLMYGAVWLAEGFAARAILLQLFPRDRWLGYVGGALTICATGDLLADSLVSLHYEISALSYFVALLCFLKWMTFRRWPWLAAAGLSLSASIWTTDVAFASIVLTPMLLWTLLEERSPGRWAIATGAIGAAFLPYAFAFIRLLRTPGSYVRSAIVPMGIGERLSRIGVLFLCNFSPWTWWPMRKNWLAPPAPVIPRPVLGLGAVAGAAIFAAGIARFRQCPGPDDSGRDSHGKLRLLVASLAMALASNAAFSFVTVSGFFYRTQIISRTWASLAIALVASLLRGRGKTGARTSAILVVVFAGFGVAGGLERQDYFLSFWLRHRAELRSIVKAAPRVLARTGVILDVPAGRLYMATHKDYLAEAWVSLLYSDPAKWSQTFVSAPGSETECAAEGEEIICRSAEGLVRGQIPLRNALVLSYLSKENRYVVSDQIPPSMRKGGRFSEWLYRPRAEITAGPPTRMARRILYAPRFLARFLSAENEP